MQGDVRRGARHDVQARLGQAPGGGRQEALEDPAAPPRGKGAQAPCTGRAEQIAQDHAREYVGHDFVEEQ